ncbi:hypothetical protein 40AC_37 [Mycobacterium phage 40AC]|uniref:Uncharacterized protein n=1 Tax=Mycobacterium phage 40AC TaxID=1458717 RepID=W8EGC0_9CAUD|nr:hypothetical protein ST40AC_37 [Mycobacterium phage 40AC]AHJ86401.1 hypothetical protein 40AC_37 [Mycobacterium phage 40AC]
MGGSQRGGHLWPLSVARWRTMRIDRCKVCGADTVWRQMAKGHRVRFDAGPSVTREVWPGECYADMGRGVVNLRDVKPSRWPEKCLTVHWDRCPDSYKPSGVTSR